MTTLLVDVGNTRVKWALLRGSRLSPMQALTHGRAAVGMHAVILGAMVEAPDLERIIAVSVAGPVMERALAGASRARLKVTVEFVRSQRAAAGVRNGYREVWRLGADRWVGVVGAHAIAGRRPVLVANIGTALTLDAVTGTGRHLGGAIVAGPDAMVASMLKGTHGIARRAAGAGPRARKAPGLFARDTAGALESGALHAAAAVVDRAAVEAKAALGGTPLVLLTGGGAPQLQPLLRSRVRMVPDLVLRGLAVLAGS